MHWGAAGKDLIDTTLMIELRLAIDALLVDLDRAIDAFTSLAGRHRRTATVGRAGLQHTLPMPFGLKAAGYAAALARARERLRRLRKEGLALQLGGPAGTLASLGERAGGHERQRRERMPLRLPAADRRLVLLDLRGHDGGEQIGRQRRCANRRCGRGGRAFPLRC